jgi:hypothetical protein
VIKTGACNLPSPVFVITAAEPEVAVSETRVYPNPVTAATDLNVEVPVGVLPANVTIINTMGQVVFSGTVEEDRITIPTGNFSAGVYFVDVKTRTSTVRRKIVITH